MRIIQRKKCSSRYDNISYDKIEQDDDDDDDIKGDDDSLVEITQQVLSKYFILQIYSFVIPTIITRESSHF